MAPYDGTVDRRRFLLAMAAISGGAALAPRLLLAEAAAGAGLSEQDVATAERLAGVSFDAAQRKLMEGTLEEQLSGIRVLHGMSIDASTPPALVFDPAPPGLTSHAPAEGALGRERTRRPRVTHADTRRPAAVEELAYAGVAELSRLLRSRAVSSIELTTMWLDRIARLDPQLLAVITVTQERAMEQAARADAEIARGRWRGPLHGIAWGAKDLLAVAGYRTTWGAGPYRAQVIDADAEAVRRLDAAGAVLVAKLSLGELAMGDVWFGGRTNNPWHPTRSGSSGSSAGPAAATAAGLVGFAVGSETLGSISSPCTRVGATGLRPTFGRVPRTGAMALSWSMDKLGPIARSADDCALVLEALAGADGADPSARGGPFTWDGGASPRTLRVGWVRSAFEQPRVSPKDATKVLHETEAQDSVALDVLRRLDLRLVPVDLPDFPHDALWTILLAEAAAAFDDLTRSGRDAQLVQQGKDDWANTFRAARFIPAVDYVNANRARTMLMRAWDVLFRDLDVIVTPTEADGLFQLVATNFTGHPAVIVPNGFREFEPEKGDRTPVPVSLTFLGRIDGERDALSVAKAYQDATTWHLKQPPLFAVGGA